MEEFAHMFEGVADPRRSNATLRDPDRMPMIGLPSAPCGGGGCADMERFGRAGEGFRAASCGLRTAFRASTPSPTRSTRRIPGACSGRCRGLPGAGRPGWAVGWRPSTAGRCAGRSPLRRRGPRRNRCGRSPKVRRPVLGRVRVEDRSDGIATVSALLGMPAPKGRVVTADAMRTQRRTARAVTAAGGDHVPAPKGNRGGGAVRGREAVSGRPGAGREPPVPSGR